MVRQRKEDVHSDRDTRATTVRGPVLRLLSGVGAGHFSEHRAAGTRTAQHLPSSKAVIECKVTGRSAWVKPCDSEGQVQRYHRCPSPVSHCPFLRPWVGLLFTNYLHLPGYFFTFFVLWTSSFLFFSFFGCTHVTWKFQGQGWNPCHSSHHARSLTH